MSQYYPIMLKLKGKKAIVVGGGKVATRKVKTLLDSEAQVIVISPQVTNDIWEWFRLGKLTWLKKEFEQDDLQDGFVVIAATNHSSVNLAVYEALVPHQLINIVDNPELSTFIVPSTLHRGKLTIAVSTSGASPGLARQIKQDLSARYDESYEEYLVFLEQARTRIIEEVKDSKVKEAKLKQLLDPCFLELTQQKSYAAREEALLKLIQNQKPTEPTN